MDPATASPLRAAPLTYPELGATADVLPDGYRHMRRRALVGTGLRAFADGGDALVAWQAELPKSSASARWGSRVAESARPPAGSCLGGGREDRSVLGWLSRCREMAE